MTSHVTQQFSTPFGVVEEKSHLLPGVIMLLRAFVIYVHLCICTYKLN
jgi:hypothetical protein